MVGTETYTNTVGILFLDDIVPEHTVNCESHIAFDAAMWVPRGAGEPPPPPIIPYDVRRAHFGLPGYGGQGADPVSTGLGNFVTQHQDLYVPGRGLPVNVTRVYNSLDTEVYAFGRGWASTYDMRTLDRGNKEIILTFADGRAGLYKPEASDPNAYITPDGFFATLRRAGDELVLTDVDQTVYTFNHDGKLDHITDANQNSLTFRYDPQNGQTLLTDTVGRVFTLDVNATGRIKAIHYPEPDHRTVWYEYQGDNLVTFHDALTGTIQYAYTPNTSAVGDPYLISITDPNGHTFVTNHYDALGRVDVQTDASGSETHFTYTLTPTTTLIRDNLQQPTFQEFDANYRLLAETDALTQTMHYGYDDNNNRTYQRDRGGHETFMTYDSRGNLLTIRDALVQTTTFTYDAHNKLTLAVNAAGDRTQYFYDPSDNLIRIIDAAGGQTDLHYDKHGQLLEVDDANTHPTYFTYDSQGNLRTVEDALHHITTYTYDGVGRRLSMTDANQHTATFAYDANDRVTRIIDPKLQPTGFVYDAVGNLKQVTDRRGYLTSYLYDDNDSLTDVFDRRTMRWRYTYDLMYHRTSATTARGFTTMYGYNPVYDLVRVTDPTTHHTDYAYDPDHNLTQITDAAGYPTTLDYDALHRVITQTDALTGTTTYRYDPVGRLTLRTDPRGGQTQLAYDHLGRVLSQTDALSGTTTFRYDPVGNRLAMTNTRGITTTSAYDAVNRVLTDTDPLGLLQALAYDPVGNVRERTDANHNRTQYGYDQNDNLEHVIDALNGPTDYTYDAEDNPTAVTDPNRHTRTFDYDPEGNVLTETLPLSQTTGLRYDEDSNLTQLINAKHNVTTFDYDPRDLLITRTTPLGFPTTYGYDSVRQLTRLTDANGHPTAYAYDPLHRLVTVTDALTGTTQYAYDALGYLTGMRDANAHPTTFGVDLLGRVVSETNAITSTWRYTYDPLGNRTSRQDANGVLTSYTYDARNRLTDVAYPSPTGVHYAYDGNGNLTGLTDPTGAAAFSYDALNRLAASTRTSGLMAGATLGYGYDPVGNRTRVAYPDGRAVTYAYNANDWLTTVTDPQAGPTTYTRDDVGLPTHQANPNGTWTDSTYDPDDRLTNLFNGHPPASTNVISSFDYTRDNVGNITRTVERVTRGQVVTWDKRYTYDALNRLTDAVFTPDTNPYQVLTSAYTYDPVGNRLAQTTNIADSPNTPALPAPVTTTYTYNAANALLGASSSKGSTGYSYDANGNRTLTVGPDRVISTTYDLENRPIGDLTYDVLPNGRWQYDSTLDYSYDGLGQRLERGVRDNGVRKTADYLYDGLGYDLLVQYVDPGAPRTTYYYRDLTQVLSRHEIQGGGNGLQYFHHYDGLGNVSAWTNQAGQAVQEYLYAPYGRLIDNNGPDNASNRTDPHTNLTWAGKPWDKETERNDFGARDYDSTAGVWTTQDTYRGKLSDPMTLHRYGYVAGNPATLVDRYGFSAQPTTPNPDDSIGRTQPLPPTMRISSSNSTGQQVKNDTVQLYSQNGALEHSLNGGTRPIECGFTMNCMPRIGCGYTMNCPYAQSSYYAATHSVPFPTPGLPPPRRPYVDPLTFWSGLVYPVLHPVLHPAYIVMHTPPMVAARGMLQIASGIVDTAEGVLAALAAETGVAIPVAVYKISSGEFDIGEGTANVVAGFTGHSDPVDLKQQVCSAAINGKTCETAFMAKDTYDAIQSVDPTRLINYANVIFDAIDYFGK